MIYVYHLAIAFDQLFNAVLAGSADETLSSRTYRKAVLSPKPKKRWRFAHFFINSLFFWQKEHCRQSYWAEKNRKHWREKDEI